MKISKIILLFLLFLNCSLLFKSRNPHRLIPDSPIVRSTDPITLIGQYKGWACGGLTSQIMPIEMDDTLLSICNISFGFEFYTSSIIKSPDNISDICVPGNEYVLKGYYYYWLKDGKKILTERFDLVVWKLVVPYSVWINLGEREDKDIPYDKYWNKVEVFVDKFSKARKYDNGCL